MIDMTFREAIELRIETISTAIRDCNKHVRTCHAPESTAYARGKAEAMKDERKHLREMLEQLEAMRWTR